MTESLNCPLCGKRLTPQWRVKEERVPSTVPDYFSRWKEAPYRVHDNWTELKCSNQHWFKRRGDALFGMEARQPTTFRYV